MSAQKADPGPEAVAIVGISCRFPGAVGVEELWHNLRDGVESVRFFDRRELAEAGVPSSLLDDPSYVPAQAVLGGSDLFDAGFFGLTPRVAEATDPQHRLFLECAWEALERAGYDAASHRGAIGLFAGTSMNTYLLSRAGYQERILGIVGEQQAAIGNRTDHLTLLVAYKLDLRGPVVTVQSTCSTSLVAVHLACQSLLNYQCHMALAGGASVQVPQTAGYLYQPGGINSPDGHCRPFDAAAQGTLTGSGVGIVVLKRLADALKDGDEIHAVIRGSAINNDGAVKAGYTAPSSEGQAKVIAMAHAVAGVRPEEIGYVEAHGTGTPLGDPIEVAALNRVFRAKTGRSGFCALGAVKSNFGHLDTAAGIAGLIKTTLVLKHGQIPPTLHFERPNPELRLEGSPFYVPTALTEWPRNGGPRRAGVSAFGIGGTNAHAILEEAPPAVPSSPSRPVQLLLLSARTASALEAMTDNLRHHLETETGQSLADVAYTLRVGRRPFEARRAAVCHHREEAVEVLGSLDPGLVYTSMQEPRQRPVTFLFPGQGAQRARMGVELYDSEEVFRREVDRCCAALEPWLGLDLRRELLAPEAESRLEETFLTQPALFVIEYALAHLWMSWGVSPRAMIGHSLGEYVAACLAGVFSLDDALRLVAVRGRLMQALPLGAMLSVQLPEAELRQRLGERLSLAAVNRPSLCVVSGPVKEIDLLEREISAEGVACRRLRTTRAFHSNLVEPALAPFAGELAGVELKPPAIPFVSNLTGRWILPEEATDPDYWVRHLRSAVRFGDGLETLLRQGEGVLLEIGPGRTLSSIARQHPAWTVDHLLLASLPHGQQESELTTLLTTLGRLWVAGNPVDWNAFQGGERRRRVTLPTYPFERRRYWCEPKKEDDDRPLALRGEWKKDPSDWFWLPSWRRTTPPALLRHEPLEPARRWLVFADRSGLGEAVSSRLEQLGQEVIRVTAGESLTREGRRFALAPGRPEDYRDLLADLRASGGLPHRIVHLWSVDADHALERGFFSLLYLAQAVGTGEDEPLRIDVVSTGMQEVAGGDLRSPEKAALLGPCKVLPKEYANLRCRSIDLSGPEEVEPLIAELLAEGSEKLVAHRGGHRWVQTFERVRLERPAEGTGLRPSGVYLVTGGFGGMGSTLAAHLAQACSAKLILTGRSPLPERADWTDWLATRGENDPASRKIRQIRELEASGAEVLAAGVDVADAEGMRQVLAAARDRFGPLHGVFHTAGISPGGLAQLKTGDAALRTLSPKLEGTRVLASLLAGEDLDFFLLCSSRSAIFGPAGGIDYAAANAFLDAFAHTARIAGIPRVVSINWCGWDEVGMMAQAIRDSRGSTAEEEGEPVAHPLLDRRWVEPGRETYLTEFSARTRWVLNEHRIVGNPVVPGTTYLEMARAAAARRGLERIELCDVYFLTPLRLREDGSCEVRLALEETEGRLEFQVASRPRSGAGEWLKHVFGRIEPLAVEAPERRDVEEIRRRCSVREILAAARDEQNEDFGPRWQSVSRVFVGEGEVLATLELPETFAGDLATCALHPALLDRAASIGEDYIGEGFGGLPFSYRSLRLFAPLSRRIYSHARLTSQEQSRGETISFDVDLLDEAGNVLVEIREYHKKRINDTTEKLRLPEAALSPEPLEPAKLALRAGISPSEGIEVFLRILAHPCPPQIVISPNDLLEAVAAEEAYRPPELARLDRETGEDGSAETARHDRPELSTRYVAPETGMQNQLAEIWRELLGFRNVGIHDNFFELGGDSILAIQIIARASKAGVEISSGQIFEHQTLAELAASLEKSGSRPQGAAPTAPPLAPVPRGGDLPLSFAQERLWFLARLDPDSPAYNVPTAIRINGRLNPASLVASLRDIVQRHEVLRTHFAEVEGRPVQVIETEGRLETALVDLAGIAEEGHSPLIRRLIAEQSTRLFDLERCPLLRVTLFRLSAEEHLLLSAFHHTVVDGWALGVYQSELQELYTARAMGRPAHLRDLPVQYADYAAWQRSWLSDEVLERKLEFWRRSLAGVPPVLDLATDRPRPLRKSFKAGTCPLYLPASVAAIGRRREATLFMTLLALFGTLLSRLSGQEDLVVGTPVANRDRPGLEALIGLFLNTLPLRTDLSGDPAFTELLERVQRTMPEVYANQDLPFEKLVDALDLPRSLRHAPLLQAVLVLRSFPPVDPMALEGLAFEPEFVESAGAQFDLSLVVGEADGDVLPCLLEYDRDLFDPSTMQRMAGHLVELARGVTADANRRLSGLPLLSESERHQLRVEWNDTRILETLEAPGVVELFEAQALRSPDAVAVLAAGGAAFTYSELDAQADHLAGRLRRLGAGPEAVVGLCVEHTPELAIAVLGILKSGAAYLPLDPASPPTRLDFLLEDSAVPVLVTQPHLLSNLPPHCAETLLLEAGEAVGETAKRGEYPALNDLAYLIYTSGTTGRPKAVQVEHGMLAATLAATQERFGFTAGNRMPCLALSTFDISLFELLSPLLSGGTAVLFPLRPTLDVESVVDHLGEMTCLHAVPALMQGIVEAVRRRGAQAPDLGGMRAVFVGGDTVPAELLEDLRETFPAARVWVLYGPTEGTILCAAHPVPPPPAPARPLLGWPVAGALLDVRDSHGELLPVGVPGELWIGGAGVTRGYLGREELTAEKYVPSDGTRFYRSGDRVRRLADGTLEFLGRTDHQVKIRGFRIEPGEIERVLQEHPGVQQAVVVVRTDGPAKQLVAYSVAAAVPPPAAADLRSFLAERLPAYMVPAVFLDLPALPLSPNGKVDRAALPAPDAALSGAEREHTAPRTREEEILVTVWEQVLRLPGIGVDDNFFELGGDSILSLQIVARACQAGLLLTVRQLFEHQTVAELARHAAAVDASAHAEQGPVTGEVPLTPIQRRFFAEDPADLHHFNQALVLEPAEPLDPATLEGALAAVVAHHDALRLRFTRQDQGETDGWRQENAATEPVPPFHRIDLSGLPAAGRRDAFEQAATTLQTGFDLAAGPLTRLARFEAGAEEPELLVWVAHHLVVDAVSWRLLLEDLERAYRQAVRGLSIALPPKTTSFRDWARHLVAHAASDALDREAGHWLAQARTPVPRLPVDVPGEGQSLVGEEGSVSFELTAEETEDLLRTVPTVYHNRIDEALLSALVRALAPWTGSPRLLVDLEGHGREPLSDEGDPDISRTVGWFTTIHPIVLESGNADPGTALVDAKERLRAMPARGIGYGLLRYLGDAGPARLLAQAPAAEVGFNYLGQLDPGGPSLFQVSMASAGPTLSPRARRTHLLEVTGLVIGGQLRITLAYGSRAHRRETAQRLAAAYAGALRQLIRHSREREDEVFTSSDFPKAELDARSFDKLAALLAEAD